MTRSFLVLAFSCLVACGGGGKDNAGDAECGNGVVEGVEGCDDGNLVDGDGCSATCTPAMCGDGVRDFNEACDDGNQTNGDGCDINCTESYCGNGLKSDDEMCDDGNRVDGDGCDNNCRPSGCGNGTKTGTEECDDGNTVQGDGCDNNCTTSACGNGVMAGNEECDDGNTDGLDGCSAVCTTEIVEIEPNDDGTTTSEGVDIDGNDFGTTGADANGAIMASTTRIASIDPAGDEDVWAFTNPSTANVTVKFDVWNVATGYGIGMPCGESIDTGMHIRDAAGNSLASNDDRDGGDDRCSTITFGLLAGQTRYVHVVDFDDDDVIPSYALQVTYTPVVCGNNVMEIGEQCDDGNTMAGDGCDAMCHIEVVCGDSVLQPTEQCDDGNTMAGDGCSATCQLEGAVGEVEPNEDGTPSTGGSTTTGNDFGITHADTNGAITANRTIAASLTPTGDEDVFKITNTTAATVELRLDVWNVGPGYHIGMPCGTSIDTAMHIRSAAGASLALNDDRDGANDRCSTLKYALAAGATVYAHVSEYSDDAPIGAYALVVQLVPIVCGDGTVGVSEQCDDGNTMNGDGCSSTCQIEVVCGDGVVGSTEQCDDGNTMNGDGCSSTCQFETQAETEPNDDGTPSTGGSGTVGNDFSSTNANGPFNHSIVITAALAVAGDEDVFAFTNPGASAVNVRFDIWNLASGYGIGAVCGTSIDTALHIRDAAGTSLADNDDRDGSTDRCSALTYSIAAGATVYVHVIDYGDSDAIASYALQAKYQ